MDFDAWAKLLGKNEQDADVKAALISAGIKKLPKRDPDDTAIQVELKGAGLEVVFTDEASLKQLDEPLGKRPLVLCGVLAKLGKAHGRDLYKGALPSGIQPAISRAELRKLLGKPKICDVDVDIWKHGKAELSVDYAKDLASLTALSVMLPNAM